MSIDSVLDKATGDSQALILRKMNNITEILNILTIDEKFDLLFKVATYMGYFAAYRLNRVDSSLQVFQEYYDKDENKIGTKLYDYICLYCNGGSIKDLMAIWYDVVYKLPTEGGMSKIILKAIHTLQYEPGTTA